MKIRLRVARLQSRETEVHGDDFPLGKVQIFGAALKQRYVWVPCLGRRVLEMCIVSPQSRRRIAPRRRYQDAKMNPLMMNQSKIKDEAKPDTGVESLFCDEIEEIQCTSEPPRRRSPCILAR